MFARIKYSFLNLNYYPAFFWFRFFRFCFTDCFPRWFHFDLILFKHFYRTFLHNFQYKNWLWCSRMDVDRLRCAVALLSRVCECYRPIFFECSFLSTWLDFGVQITHFATKLNSLKSIGTYHNNARGWLAPISEFSHWITADNTINHGEIFFFGCGKITIIKSH